MTTLTRPMLIVRNPATGAELEPIEMVSPETVPEAVAHARQAQAGWSDRPLRERLAVLRRWHTILARDADAWADALRVEIGKPRIEAALEVITTLDSIRWTLKNATQALADERLARGWQRLMLVPKARLRWRPVGVVGLIGTWNYPLYLTVPALADALTAGNGVVWKPSELASGIGRRIQASLKEAGYPEGLVATVFGRSEIGRALCESAIDKGHFTGGISSGRRVLAALAVRGIPATAELSGFDPAIVLPDAPRESTVRALAWAGFTNAGQTCIGVKRVYVVGDARPWADAFVACTKAMRVGNPSAGEVDMGPLICESARERFDQFIQAAKEAGARVLTGGEAMPGPGFFYQPTILEADRGNAAPDFALAGSFGPVILIRGVADAEEAIAASNATEYGLAATVWGRDHRATRAVAGRLEAGMVAINDAVAQSGHSAAPFGGVKGSGFGRTHGVLGLREFVHPQTVHDRAAGGYRPQLYPYRESFTLRGLKFYRRLFHRT